MWVPRITKAQAAESLLAESANHAKAYDISSGRLCCTHTCGGSQQRSVVAPSASAHESHRCMSFRCGPSVCGRPVIRIMPEIGSPLANVAMHVIDAKGVGRERSGFDRAGGKTEYRLRRVDRVTIVVTSAAACAAGIFPLRLRGNSVVLSRSRGEPVYKRLCLVKGNACDRKPGI